MDTKNTPFSNGAGDLLSLMTIAGLFNFGPPFGAPPESPEALEKHLTNLAEKLIDLNLIVASLLGSIHKGISGPSLLDINITRLRSIAEDIGISHKLYTELTRATTAEAPEATAEPTIQNQTSNIQK